MLIVFKGVNVFASYLDEPKVVPFFKESSILHVDGGVGFTMVLQSNGNVYAMGDKYCCAQYSTTSNYYIPVLVSVSNVRSILCSIACTILRTSDNAYYAFGNADAQPSPAYGKITVNPTQMNNLPNVPIKTLVASCNAFFLLSTNGEMFVIGNDDFGEMNMQRNVNSWTKSGSKVSNVFVGRRNSFLLS